MTPPQKNSACRSFWLGSAKAVEISGGVIGWKKLPWRETHQNCWGMNPHDIRMGVSLNGGTPVSHPKMMTFW